ncbi:MAG: TonB-dependent receptor [Opitutaceae bacterium]|nr:TonB-dependent receptor [Opitutaceae bacterium]
MNPARPRLALLVSLALTFLLSLVTQAQTAATGRISGRVFNPATREYVRDAKVSVQGTSLSTTSEPGGFFHLDNVPAGAAKVVVTYAGYDPTVAAIQVEPGATAQHDFELILASRGEDDTVELDTFVVSSEREGNAKAMQQAKNSMTVGRAVASDAFGDVTEGNVGEFLKYLPGVELEYVEADTRGPRLGGMGAEYASVSMDGMKLASADAFAQYVNFENSAAGSANRSFGFEQVSINSIESIEINRVTTAAMDADAPAGNINLKTKRAFDSKGRRIGWNLGTVLNTEEFHLGKSIGPNDSEGHKMRRNYSLNYSDVFLDNRLGILVGVSESNLYNEQYRVDHTYNRSATATDTRPQVLTQILLKDGPKWTERFTGTLTADFRATDELTLSLGVVYNTYDARFYNRQVTMQASANNTGATTGRQNVAGDGVLSYGTTTTSTNASRQVVFGGGNGVKLTDSISVIPKFEYRHGDWLLDGAFAWSYSSNDYDNLAQGTVGGANVANLQNVQFTATRSGPDEADWKFTQTGGADWADLANLTNPRISDDNRQAVNEVFSGELNTRYNTRLAIPTFLRFGAKWREYGYEASNSNPYDVWSYIGPGGNPVGGTTGTFVNFPTEFEIYDRSQVGAQFTSITGGGSPAFANRDELGRLFRSNPEYFLRNSSVVSATAYEQGKYTNERDLIETITAGYLMANTRLADVQIQGGIRYEGTNVMAREWDPRSPSEIIAAGYPVTAAGAPTTWAGMDYKYASKPRVEREGDYHNYFPSLTAKYSVGEDLLLDLGWGKTIKRPNIGLLSGVWTIDETNEVINAANPNLKPERSEKIVAGASYYFGATRSNNLQVVLSRNEVRDLQSQHTYTSEEFGNTDPTYENYEFVSWSNEGAPITFSSMELSYVQSLTFLPRAFQGTSVSASYTRTYASERRPGVVPHSLKGGISYRYKWFNIAFNGVWRDESPWFQGTTNRYLKANAKFDLSGGFRITDRVSLYFQGRNIFEEPHRIYEMSPGYAKVLYRYENYGTNWSFGVRGTF